jgi:hypothetical protein
MFGLGPTELLPLAVIGVSLWLNARVIQKTGFSPKWTFISLVPALNIVALWCFRAGPAAAAPQEASDRAREVASLPPRTGALTQPRRCRDCVRRPSARSVGVRGWAAARR